VDKKTRQTFLLWAETEEHKQAVVEAEKVIEKALKQFNKSFVSYSGGKDSLAMLHLVLQQHPNVTVIHWDYGPYFMPREIEREIIENAKKIGVKNLLVKTSPLYEKLGRKARNILGRHFIGKVIPELVKEGYDCCFLGLRAEESNKRKRRTKIFFEKTRIITNVFPLARWRWLDSWAYIISKDLPYPHVYDLYGPVLGWDKARLVTFFDHEFDWVGAPLLDGVLMPEKRYHQPSQDR